ncbi:hypothetical protein [Candidatus Entotheonella palauensis]|uniref:hypothetical protein n=1 Tax=Candidatus Entotheonella palauensis TaxID=93172 RepID=UPI0011789DFE|nr:hypothetical protein [Candidatus Entotheonella palauensis]
MIVVLTAAGYPRRLEVLGVSSGPEHMGIVARWRSRWPSRQNPPQRPRADAAASARGGGSEVYHKKDRHRHALGRMCSQEPIRQHHIDLDREPALKIELVPLFPKVRHGHGFRPLLSPLTSELHFKRAQ